MPAELIHDTERTCRRADTVSRGRADESLDRGVASIYCNEAFFSVYFYSPFSCRCRGNVALRAEVEYLSIDRMATLVHFSCRFIEVVILCIFEEPSGAHCSIIVEVIPASSDLCPAHFGCTIGRGGLDRI